MLVRHGSPGSDQRNVSAVFMDLHCCNHGQMEIYAFTHNVKPYMIYTQMFSFHTCGHMNGAHM